ncbi:lectin-like domain-containing protein [Companilactobacillus sp. HBUAS59699]|uniref:lectin-like domain-containing protein n=1 Tax=Companilactobacillus sp. HBUAS59699 TaxID=3109358 RepID=UPI002FF035EB
MRRRKLPLTLFSLLMAFFVLYCSTNRVNATTRDDEATKAVAPRGLSLTDKADAKNYFTYVKKLGRTDPRDNSARIIEQPNKNNPNTDAVLLTDDVNQLGTIWSDENKNNYIDTSVKQTLSMWLYFGYAKNPADGIAVVLQNGGADAVDIDKDGIAHGGETLGVWGTDNEPANGEPQVIASRAIPRSWALEFDTFMNNSGVASSLSAFDTYLNADENNNNQHVAWNYPADPGTYTPDYGTGGGNGSLFYMYHNDAEEFLRLTGNSKPEYSWHHLTLEYTPPADSSTKASLKYTFNDKLIDGTPGTVPENRKFSHNVSLDLTKFADKDGIIPNKLRYGFTGSTGAEASVNMAIFETMPSLVNADISSNVFDLSQAEREVLSGDQNVRDGDDMKIGYNLIYETGKRTLKNAVARLNLPKHLQYADSGVIGQVNYSDGTVDQITADQVNDGVLTYNYTKEFDLDMRAASIYIYGKAKVDNNADTKVPAAHGIIEGDLYKGDVSTPDFTIIPRVKKLNIAKLPSTTSVEVGKSLELNGTMTLSDDKQKLDLNNEDVYQIYRIDGGDIKYGRDTTSPNGKFSITLNTGNGMDKIRPGKHTIEVYALTTDLISSEEILKYDVDVHEKNPVLTTDNTDITVLKSDNKVNLPAKVSYEDAHKFDTADLTWHMRVDDGEESTEKIQESQSSVDQITWTQIFEASELGITDTTHVPYLVHAYVTDKYGGKSNELAYEVTLLSNSVSLDYEPDYSFEPVNTSGEDIVVKRNGKWKLGVNSTDSTWKLSASASKLFSFDQNDNKISELNGGLIYVNKSGISLPMSSEVLIAEDDEKETLDFDVAKEWRDYTGVLLQVQPHPSGGKYKGEIDWYLSNTI